MDIKSIQTEEEYQQALIRLGQIFDAKKGSPEGEELKILSALIEEYEDLNFPFPKQNKDDKKSLTVPKSPL